jgi:hypothetical protein
MTDDLKKHALLLAHTADASADVVVDRAKAYFDFLISEVSAVKTPKETKVKPAANSGKPATPPNGGKTTTTPNSEPTKIDLEAVRAAIRNVANLGGSGKNKPAAFKILSDLGDGADSVSSLKPEVFGPVYMACQKALGKGQAEVVDELDPTA